MAGLTGEEAYILSRKYTKDTVNGGGAVSGKNVVIKSIEPISGGNRITFGYTMDDGTEKTQTLDVMDGKDGEKDYEKLINLPFINGIEIKGRISLESLGAQEKGDYLTEIPQEYVTEDEIEEYIPKETVDLDFSNLFI